MPLIEIKNIVAGYGGVKILQGVSFYISEREIVALIGSNGAGKTTLLKAISGLLIPSEGEIIFDGKSTRGLRPDEVVELGIVQVPEGRQLFPFLTVEKNLKAGSYSKKARKMRKKNLNEVFELFPVLSDRTNQLAGTLSGGEQQMLATARALMACPKLLIMDEPSWGLAPILVKKFFATCEEINKRGCTLLIVEQHVQQALSISNRAYVMERGNVVIEGKSQDLMKDPRLREIYLGI